MWLTFGLAIIEYDFMVNHSTNLASFLIIYDFHPNIAMNLVHLPKLYGQILQ